MRMVISQGCKNRQVCEESILCKLRLSFMIVTIWTRRNLVLTYECGLRTMRNLVLMYESGQGIRPLESKSPSFVRAGSFHSGSLDYEELGRNV